MAKQEEVFEVNLPIKDCLKVCQEAVASLGWAVMHQDDRGLDVKEGMPQVTSFTWPAKVEIILRNEKSPEKTKIILNGSIFGFGPIQSGHLKGQIGNLRNRIEIASANFTQSSSNPPSITAELEKLAQLHSAGHLSDDEYNKAKARLLNLP